MYVVLPTPASKDVLAYYGARKNLYRIGQALTIVKHTQSFSSGRALYSTSWIGVGVLSRSLKWQPCCHIRSAVAGP
jgi:hypothetical protein